MTEKTWKCPLCPQRIILKEREKHLQTHIDQSYNEEVQALHRTQRAEALLRKVTNEI